MNTKLLLAGGAALAAIGAYFVTRKLSPTEASIRHAVVGAAVSQMGKNDPTPYWLDVVGTPQPRSMAWCGAFALWALHQAGLALDKKWIPGQGFLMTHGSLPQTKTPQPGDIAYFTKYEHHAVIANVYADKTMDLVNGNGQNRAVSPSIHSPISSATAIFSIKPYIDQKLKRA